MRFQIGKSGITPGVIESLAKAFRTHKTIRISLLKSVGMDRNEKKKIADELCEKLSGNYKYTIIGFTIVLRKAGKG